MDNGAELVGTGAIKCTFSPHGILVANLRDRSTQSLASAATPSSLPGETMCGFPGRTVQRLPMLLSQCTIANTHQRFVVYGIDSIPCERVYLCSWVVLRYLVSLRHECANVDGVTLSPRCFEPTTHRRDFKPQYGAAGRLGVQDQLK